MQSFEMRHFRSAHPQPLHIIHCASTGHVVSAEKCRGGLLSTRSSLQTPPTNSQWIFICTRHRFTCGEEKMTPLPLRRTCAVLRVSARDLGGRCCCWKAPARQQKQPGANTTMLLLILCCKFHHHSRLRAQTTRDELARPSSGPHA